MLQHAATPCNALKHAATPCNTLQRTCCLAHALTFWGWISLQHPATPCNTLQHPATPCNTLQRTPVAWHTLSLSNAESHCNTLQHPATPCSTLQHPTTPCNAHLWHGTRSHFLMLNLIATPSNTLLDLTATLCNTLQCTPVASRTLSLSGAKSHCNTLQQRYWISLQHSATHFNAHLWHRERCHSLALNLTATRCNNTIKSHCNNAIESLCNTLQHTSTHTCCIAHALTLWRWILIVQTHERGTIWKIHPAHRIDSVMSAHRAQHCLGVSSFLYIYIWK